MAQIPYSPVPTVAPSEAPTPGFRLNTPEGAFGGGVAGATEGLGRTISSTGNELFGRAMAMQQLNNEAEARDADTKYMMQAGTLHADFSSLEGADAKAAFPKYQKDLADARVKLRDSLSNPMSQKMFDAQSLSTMGRSIFNGAGHAAQQFKNYQIGTGVAQMAVDAKSVEDDPNDEGLFQDKLQRTAQNASHVAALKGAPAGSPQEQLGVLTATSKLWAQRITGLSRTAPFEAAKVLDANKANLTADDYLKVDNTVRASGRAVGSVNIANEVYNPDKSLKDMEAEARDKANKQSPDDPLLASHTVAALQHKYNQDKAATRQEQVSNEQIIYTALQSGVENEQELRADPKVAAAIDALPSTSPLKKTPLNSQIIKFNNQRDRDAMDQNWVRLRGLASNDIEEFMNTNLNEERLSPAKRDQLLSIRDKIMKQPEGDPRVNHAITKIRGAMGAQLEALDVFERTKKNQDDYDKYTGALQSALDVFQETNKRPPTYKELTDKDGIASEVLKTVQQPGFFNAASWGGEDKGTHNKYPRFKAPPPDDFTEKLITDVKSKGGLEPTPEQIQRAYTRTQFMQLYGKKKDGQ